MEEPLIESESHSISEEDAEERPIFTAENLPYLAPVYSAAFFCSLLVSIIVPFFPDEASARAKTDVSPFVVGVIFAVFPFSAMLASPVACIAVRSAGWRLVLHLGIATCTAATIGFGFSRSLALFFVFRILQGFSTGAVTVAGTSILSRRFPTQLGTVVGLYNAMGGVAFMCGPAVGGVLFDVGGFHLPFVVIASVTGVAQLAMLGYGFYFDGSSISSQNNLVDSTHQEDPAGSQDDGACNNNQELKFGDIVNPRSCMAAVAVIFGFMVPGFLDPTLADHLGRVLGMSASQSGFMFLIATASFALCGGLAGVLTDKYGGRIVISAGFCSAALGFMLIGPMPPLAQKLPQEDGSAWFTEVLGLVLLGSAASLLSVPGLPVMQRSLDDSNSDDTEELVAGLFAVAQGLGECLGPLIGGALSDSLPHSKVMLDIFV